MRTGLRTLGLTAALLLPAAEPVWAQTTTSPTAAREAQDEDDSGTWGLLGLLGLGGLAGLAGLLRRGRDHGPRVASRSIRDPDAPPPPVR